MDDRIAPSTVNSSGQLHLSGNVNSFYTAGAKSAIVQRLAIFFAQEGRNIAVWLPVFFGLGITAWFVLPMWEQWAVLISGGVIIAGLGIIGTLYLPQHGRWISLIIIAVLTLCAGCTWIYGKSLLTGTAAIEKPWVGTMTATIIDRDDLIERKRIRLTLRPLQDQSSIGNVRINIPVTLAQPVLEQLNSGQNISIRVRLMPPSEPLLPGGYNFARRVWFEGLSATGTALSQPVILKSSSSQITLSNTRKAMMSYVTSKMDGGAAGIAATLVTGERGAINDEDAEAMRRSGLAHLLAISGLHVSAVIGATYIFILKFLALFPSLAVRIRLPVLAACTAACAGIGYTIFTGSAVPTVRACIAAMLILLALVAGRDPISMRLVAAAAMVVLLLWPEALIGPSFQLSFAAVAAIIALHESAWLKKLSWRRDWAHETLLSRLMRYIGLLFLTGLVIEFSLMPIAIFHFHKAGLYGAGANLLAIPLTTFVIMPAIAMALAADMVGAGGLFWWLAQWGLDTVLALAHFTSNAPGSVVFLPSQSPWPFAIAITGLIIILLMKTQLRYLGVPLLVLGSALMLVTEKPTVLIGRDGQHIAINPENDRPILLRVREDSFGQDSLLEHSGYDGQPTAITEARQASCTREFCSVTITNQEQERLTILLARNGVRVPMQSLTAACLRADIVIASRRLPYGCQPQWVKVDRSYLQKHGGLALYWPERRITYAKPEDSDHGWVKPALQN